MCIIVSDFFIKIRLCAYSSIAGESLEPRPMQDPGDQFYFRRPPAATGPCPSDLGFLIKVMASVHIWSALSVDMGNSVLGTSLESSG